MHDVSNAINILDPSNKTDKGICKKGAYNSGSNDEKEGYCGIKQSSNKHADTEGLSVLWRTGTSTTKDTAGGNYEKDGTQMGNETSSKISKDIRELTREQHGVVSSAFAKVAHSPGCARVSPVKKFLLPQQCIHS